MRRCTAGTKRGRAWEGARRAERALSGNTKRTPVRRRECVAIGWLRAVEEMVPHSTIRCRQDAIHGIGAGPLNANTPARWEHASCARRRIPKTQSRSISNTNICTGGDDAGVNIGTRPQREDCVRRGGRRCSSRSAAGGRPLSGESLIRICRRGPNSKRG